MSVPAGMNATEPRTGIRHSLRVLGQQLLAIADEPSDDDDVRLRKRVAVSAGAILIVLPLQLPILGQGLALSWIVAATMPLISALNLTSLQSKSVGEHHDARLSACVRQ